MNEKRNKLRGTTLVAHVLKELREELGDEFSTAELLRAAESLIRISREEYVSRALENEREKPDYRNDNLSHAFENRIWEVLRRETRDDSIEDDRLSTDFEAQTFLYNLIERRGYD